MYILNTHSKKIKWNKIFTMINWINNWRGRFLIPKWYSKNSTASFEVVEIIKVIRLREAIVLVQINTCQKAHRTLPDETPPMPKSDSYHELKVTKEENDSKNSQNSKVKSPLLSSIIFFYLFIEI